MFEDRPLEQQHETMHHPLPALGRYTLQKKLGAGGMGEVYQAYDTKLSRVVALKIVYTRGDDAAQTQRRFQQEVACTAQLRHANIVSLYECEQVGDTCFFTMDFVDGCSLDKYISPKKLAPAQLAGIMLDILSALACAHAKKIIHRDLKPSNILIDKDGHVFVSDFGLAKQLGQSAVISQPGAILGTPAYMSPEQAHADAAHPVDQRSDIYSAGAILYELLTGRSPFGDGTPLSVIYKVVHEQPQKPHEIDPQVPPTLEKVCLKALAKEPAQRYQSAEEMAQDIRAYLDKKSSLPISHRQRRRSGTPANATHHKSPTHASYVWLAALLSVLSLLAGIQLVNWLTGKRLHQVKTRPDKVADHTAPSQRPAAPDESLPQIPQEIWSSHWHAAPGYFDFSTDTWQALALEFQARYARAYQQWYAQKYDKAVERRFLVHGAEIHMVLVAPGKFWMGSPVTEPFREEKEQRHQVIIDKPFWLGRYEVTQRQWRAVMDNNPSQSVGDQLPVERITWAEAQEFCARTQTGLPSEAQWEYACRAGTTATWYWGTEWKEKAVNNKLWLQQMRPATPTIAVGSLPPNGWGLCDMLGNVYEWCHEAHGEPVLPADKLLPEQAATINRWRRGGSWATDIDACRPAFRNTCNPNDRRAFNGMRVVKLWE